MRWRQITGKAAPKRQARQRSSNAPQEHPDAKQRRKPKPKPQPFNTPKPDELS
jgi:hypothetical protein